MFEKNGGVFAARGFSPDCVDCDRMVSVQYRLLGFPYRMGSVQYRLLGFPPIVCRLFVACVACFIFSARASLQGVFFLHCWLSIQSFDFICSHLYSWLVQGETKLFLRCLAWMPGVFHFSAGATRLWVCFPHWQYGFLSFSLFATHTCFRIQQ